MRNYSSNNQTLNSHQLTLIRDMAIDEIGAIKMYHKHLEQSNNLVLNEQIKEILSDEHKHLNTFWEILHKYDKTQCEMYMKVQADTAPVSCMGKEYVADDYNVEETLFNEVQAELQAVSDYERNLKQLPIKEVKMQLMAIIDDEKEHAEQLTKILNSCHMQMK